MEVFWDFSKGEVLVQPPLAALMMHNLHRRYHGCKGPEHELLCPLARVVCINSPFGCSLVLARRELVSHLPSCPASLLACTQVLLHLPFISWLLELLAPDPTVGPLFNSA